MYIYIYICIYIYNYICICTYIYICIYIYIQYILCIVTVSILSSLMYSQLPVAFRRFQPKELTVISRQGHMASCPEPLGVPCHGKTWQAEADAQLPSDHGNHF